MAQLGELYEAIDNVKKLGLDVTGLLKQVEEKENQVLSEEIIPSIKEIAGMLLQHFRKNIDITIHHKVGQPLSIDITDSKSSMNNDLSVKKEEISKKPLISSENYFPPKKLFYVKTKSGAHGIGAYDKERRIFKLLKGSRINSAPSKTMGRRERYEEFVKNYCDFVGGLYVLKFDHEFSSPGAASALVLGRSSNGWDDWKDDTGRTLGTVYRR